ncbi:MAG: LamG-like jellyroll fold domain-containing protein [Planctomycetota bacterium]
MMHRCWLGLVLLFLTLTSSSARASSFEFVVNAQSQHDYGHQLTLPPTFGAGEFTLELWVLPDSSFPVGPTGGGAAQLTNWADADNAPYSFGSWWYDGNFLLDGHNNASFAAGTFSLQFYGGGRVRWLFGDGTNAGPGGHWSVGAYPATATASLLDGGWHQITLVRRWSGVADAQLELWVDGTLVATETSSSRTNMRQYWDSWTGFPALQEGWFWGAEKQAAIGVLSQYEDYKGLLDEVRFWDRAKSASEIATSWNAAVSGLEPGLVGHFAFSEGAGTSACDGLSPTACIVWFLTGPTAWSANNAPLVGGVGSFIRGDFNCDGVVDVSDPIAILGSLFLGAAACCQQAGDVIGDGNVDVADPVALLGYLFATGPPPAMPFPLCGSSGCFGGACP